MPLIKRMQHFAVEVSDPDRAINWYREVLGFKLTERHPAYEVDAIPVELAFLRLGAVHHELVIVHNPSKKYAPKPSLPEDDLEGPPMFHHFAFECDSRADWLAMEAQLRARGDVRFVRGPVLHSWVDPRGDGSWGENEAFYILDPDGHRIEIFCNLATIDPDGTHRNGEGVRQEGTKTVEM
jgi:catechol 2,3-dioxygenase-like lactoylglutathione lyase family enzyme